MHAYLPRKPKACNVPASITAAQAVQQQASSARLCSMCGSRGCSKSRQIPSPSHLMPSGDRGTCLTPPCFAPGGKRWRNVLDQTLLKKPATVSEAIEVRVDTPHAHRHYVTTHQRGLKFPAALWQLRVIAH